MVGAEATAIVAHRPPHPVLDLLSSRSGNRSSTRTISGGSLRSLGVPSTTSTSFPRARIESLARALARFFSSALRCFAFATAPKRSELVLVEPGVPQVEGALLGELSHRLAVRVADGDVDLASLLWREFVVAASNLEACHQSFDVPLERPGVGLVEVVQAEHQPTVWGREGAEVGQVGVSAELDGEAAVRRLREV